MYNQIPDTEVDHKLLSYLSEDNIDIIINDNGTSLLLKKDNQHVNIVALPVNLIFKLKENTIFIISKLNVTSNARNIFLKKILGTYKSIISNAIQGLKKNYNTKLQILGVGYKFYDLQKEHKQIKVAIGYSHPVFIDVYDDISIVVNKDSVSLVITGPDKQLVGQMASKFLHIKKFNRYSMSGIKYAHKTINKKVITKKS
jgi:ribosomal protein L6P/L9E